MGAQEQLLRHLGLTERMLRTLKRVAGDNNVMLRDRLMAAEDFSFFAQKAPGLFIFLGASVAKPSFVLSAPSQCPRTDRRPCPSTSCFRAAS